MNEIELTIYLKTGQVLFVYVDSFSFSNPPTGPKDLQWNNDSTEQDKNFLTFVDMTQVVAVTEKKVTKGE